MAACFLASCATPESKVYNPTLYQKYDQTVLELKERVDRGELTVTEGETLRRQAFRDYLAELKEARLVREARNW